MFDFCYLIQCNAEFKLNLYTAMPLFWAEEKLLPCGSQCFMVSYTNGKRKGAIDSYCEGGLL